MSREDLNLKAKKELIEIAKEKGVVGRWDLNKSQLIDAIMVNEDIHADGTIERFEDEDLCDDKKEPAVKSSYIDQAPVGTLIAFKDENGKVRSAKIFKKSLANKKLLLVTEYSAEFTVLYENVLWVKTGSRWPKGVYELLRGITNGKTTEK